MLSFLKVSVRSALLLACAALSILFPAFCSADPILTSATAPVILETEVSTLGSGGLGCATAGITCASGPFPAGISASYSGDATATVSASNQYGTDPAVSSSIAFLGILDANVVFVSESAVGYEFAVSGPADETVPVTIEATGSSSISNEVPVGESFDAEGVLKVSTGGATVLTAATCAGDPFFGLCATKDGFGTPSNHVNRSDSFDVDNTLEITTDTVYNVVIETDANLEELSGSPYSGPDLSGTASVDPTITLDTTDPAYSLEFSPAPTPEPNYLALTAPCVAFGLIYTELRRRRNLQTS